MTRNIMGVLTSYTAGQQQQQYIFAIGGWKQEGHKPIKAGSKNK